MVDEFERTMDLIFDRMEENLKNHAVCETEAKHKIAALLTGQQERDAKIRTLQADLDVCRKELMAVILKRNVLSSEVDVFKRDLPKLSELWQAANYLLEVSSTRGTATARDRLRLALSNALNACDQIPL